MKNSKSTKRTLIASMMSLVLCVTMLLGTTLAWFTDTASTAVNKIQSGTLDIEIQNKEGVAISNLDWTAFDGREQGEILWEPGCTYELTPFKIVNVGNLALKYKIVVTGLEGNSELLDVIDFSYKINGETLNLNQEGKLEPNGASGMITVSAHMQETAGNEYMNKELEGVTITVYATQDTVEYDSNDNQYDKDAEYATPVSTEGELKTAVEAGENVVLERDIAVQNALNIESGKNITIDLNGKTVTASGNFAKVSDGTLTLTGGTIESDNTIVNVIQNGVAIVDGGTYKSTGNKIAMYAENGGKIIVNGGTFTANEFVLSPQKGGEVTVNGGTFTANDNAVIATNGSNGYGRNRITINGGTFNGNIKSSGYIACGVYVANSDTVNINGGIFNITDGVGILMRAGDTTIGKGVKINLNNTGKITAGKIGDATINISTPSYLVEDVRSGYPGATTGFTITNNSSYDLVEYK